MGGDSEDSSRRAPAATTALVIAGLIFAGAMAMAMKRSSGESGVAESPAAKEWRVVGWAYAESGDATASAAAYRRATALEPDNGENWSSLGEALQSASTSVVPEAAAALERALRLDPADPRARYFLAVQKDLSGDHAGAVADWAALLRDTPSGAPWYADLRRTLEQVAARNKIAVPGGMPVAAANTAVSGAIPGPTADQLSEAASIAPGQQDEMARGMVARLAARLVREPRDADGWIQLMRSRMVLKDPAGATAALSSGLAAFDGDPATRQRLQSAAAQLGVDGSQE